MIKRTSYNGIEEVVYTGDDVEIVRVWMLSIDEQHNRGGDMDITICDICGTRDNVNHLTYHYAISDAQTGDTLHESYDLCRDHEVVVLRKALANLVATMGEKEHDSNKKIIKIIKDMIQEKEAVWT